MVKKGYCGNESLDLSWNLRGVILYVTKIGWLDISNENIIEKCVRCLHVCSFSERSFGLKRCKKRVRVRAVASNL